MHNKNLMVVAVIAGIVILGGSLFSVSNKRLSQTNNNAAVVRSVVNKPAASSTNVGVLDLIRNAQPVSSSATTCGSVSASQSPVSTIGPLIDNYPSGGQAPASQVPLRFTITNNSTTCTIKISALFFASVSRTGGTNFYGGSVFDSINTGTVYGQIYTDQNWGMDNLYSTLDNIPLILQPGQSADLSVRIDGVHVLGLYHYIPDYFTLGFYRVYAQEFGSTINYATDFNIFSQIIKIQ